MANIIRLAHRSLLILRGSESASLLQGLLTNDLRLLNPDSGLAAFLLNNKGRIVEDLLLSRRNDDILLECSSSGRSELKSTLEKYRMRKKVEVIESDDIVSFSTESGLTDPRLPEFGFRVYGENGADNAADYFSRRVRFGIAESKTELAGLLPFQANGDLLNYVSLDKGCYIGQELTARTAHTGVVRRRIVPFSCNENVPSSPGKGIVTDENGKKVGQVICREMLLGLALLPLNSLEQALFINQQPIHAKVPSWMNDVVTARKL